MIYQFYLKVCLISFLAAGIFVTGVTVVGVSVAGAAVVDVVVVLVVVVGVVLEIISSFGRVSFRWKRKMTTATKLRKAAARLGSRKGNLRRRRRKNESKRTDIKRGTDKERDGQRMRRTKKETYK